MITKTGELIEPLWVSPDGELRLCEKHAEPIWRRTTKRCWVDVSFHEIVAYREGTGFLLPCDFCETAGVVEVG